MPRSWLVFSLYFQRHLKRRGHLVLVLFSTFLLALDYVNPHLLTPVRSAIERLVSPLDYVAAVVTDAVSKGTDFTMRVFHQAEALAFLREENSNLRQWREYAQALIIENHQLQTYFAGDVVGQTDIQHFRLQSRSRTQAGQLLHITLPSAKALPTYAAVISDSGLIGRIMMQDQRHAEVMLLSHPDSHIPVQVGPEGIQAVLIGQGHTTARLDYYHNQPHEQIRIGDAIVSSGFLRYLPSGLHIGSVIRVTAEEKEVTLAFDPDLLRYIGVIVSEMLSPAQRPSATSFGPPSATKEAS
ncbi:MAG: rod shape-determining protein MreC [Alphaproteobacteria bacterium]|nr:rod shape-determining protein MreC [Alphaproteobacteria bacterium]